MKAQAPRTQSCRHHPNHSPLQLLHLQIFDGWGSYPHDLQRCPVFQGVYYIARKFYALFQHHSTVERVPSDNGTFGLEGWHQVTCMGSSTALVLLDCRAERTIDYVVRPESWAMIQQRIAALPGSVRHVVVVATVRASK